MQFLQRFATNTCLCGILGILSSHVSTHRDGGSQRKIQWYSIWTTLKIYTFRLPSLQLQMLKTKNGRGPCQVAHMSISWSHGCFCFVLHILVLNDVMAADAAHTNRWLCGFLVRVLGSGLAARLGVNCKAWLLPFCYVTVKSKCWQGAVRVCAKTGHSCVRKVLAYSSWTKKAYLAKCSPCFGHNPEASWRFL